jgi:hypothetical protein
MTKRNLSLGIALLGAVFLAGSFVACSSKDNTPPATGGAGSGGAGASGQGNAGQGGMSGGSAAGSGGTCTMNDATKPDCSCVTGAYKRPTVCMCQDGLPNVCPTVGCVNLMLDPDNCGMCAKKCSMVSTCNGGVCGADPTASLAAIAGCNADQMSPMTLAVAGGSVYYADMTHGKIFKLGADTTPVIGGTTPEMMPTWLTGSGTNLFWYAKGAKSIRMAPAAGGTVVNVYTNNMPMGDAAAPPTIGGFAVTSDGMTVYIAVGMQVIAVKADGTTTTPTVVASEVHGGVPGAIAISGTTIVFPTALNSDVDAPPVVAGMTAICGMEDAMGNDIMTTCPRLARSQGSLFLNAIFAINNKAFWFDGPNVKSEALGSTNQTFDGVTMSVSSPITAGTATADAIYFAESDGFISKTALAKDSVAVQLARGQKAPTSIVVDATKVYWANTDCSIGSVAK